MKTIRKEHMSERKRLTGTSPSGVGSEAMVPPVPMMSTRLFVISYFDLVQIQSRFIRKG